MFRTKAENPYPSFTRSRIIRRALFHSLSEREKLNKFLFGNREGFSIKVTNEHKVNTVSASIMYASNLMAAIYAVVTVFLITLNRKSRVAAQSTVWLPNESERPLL